MGKRGVLKTFNQDNSFRGHIAMAGTVNTRLSNVVGLAFLYENVFLLVNMHEFQFCLQQISLQQLNDAFTGKNACNIIVPLA